MEWYQRVEIAQAFYDAEKSDQEAACQLLEEIEREYGVTHVVVNRKDVALDCPFVSPTFDETRFTIFAIARP